MSPLLSVKERLVMGIVKTKLPASPVITLTLSNSISAYLGTERVIVSMMVYNNKIIIKRGND